MRAAALIESAWREPAEILGLFADEPFAIGLISGGGGTRGRWSYLALDPDQILIIEPGDPRDPFVCLTDLIGPVAPGLAEGPPFQGGVAGLCAYELGDRVETLGLDRLAGWPDVACARYPAVLAFDHAARRVIAIGRGENEARASARAQAALGWMDGPPARPPPRGPLTGDLACEPPERYERAAGDVVERIGRGEIFQANIARRWRGRLAAGARPFDLLARLIKASPAPFATYLRLADRAVVSNSPERFLQVRPRDDGLWAQTRPIKGTAARGATQKQDESLASALAASTKDRAENLMIVDLMRNDLSRVCTPGTVRAPALFEVETFANVHHLVSTVEGRLQPGRTAIDLLRAAFPPGSITGAPKVQAMKVIARLEAPRGPFFGAMILAGFDGAFDSNVLIRTVGLAAEPGGWSLEARAGGGVVADSDPHAERLETEAKFAALRRALTEGV